MGQSNFAKGAVLVLAVLVLAVEGYLSYQWYQRYYLAPSGADDATSSTPTGGQVLDPEKTESEDDGKDTLVHRSAPDNILGNSTYVDHPASNGNPEAVLLVTQDRNPNGAPSGDHPIGVWYDENRGGRWAIFNQDLAPMPEGAVFGLVIREGPDADVFVHRVSPANTDGEVTYLDHPSTNAAPDAVLVVTPNWNPGGGAGTYNDHPVSIRYDAAKERWAVRNEDLAPLPARAAFGVLVRGGTS